MKEDFLYFIWEYTYFNTANLLTDDNQDVQVINPGIRNNYQGPDYLEGCIKLDDLLWYGKVEIHVRSSDWYRHQHHHDIRYDNVILHVVWENDKEVCRTDGTAIPTIVLKGRVLPQLIQQYQKLLTASSEIPCHTYVEPVLKTQALSIQKWLVHERLEEFTQKCLQEIEQEKKDWRSIFFSTLFQAFGFKANKEGFRELAKAMPFDILLKHASTPVQIEAMLFGQAGMLNRSFKDEYPQVLKKEYEFLKQKYSFPEQVPASYWHFSPVRPSNYPTIRIAQLSMMIYQTQALFEQILKIQHVQEVKKLIPTFVTDYWKNHYLFDKETSKSNYNFSEKAIQHLIINVVVPIQYAIGVYRDDTTLKNQAIHILQNLSPEDNKIIQKWKKLGIEVKHAMASQAYLQLYNTHCQYKKCLECKVGISILDVDNRDICSSSFQSF